MSVSKVVTGQQVIHQMQTSDASHGLPADCYTNTEFHQLEIETLFNHHWHCVGRSDEIPHPGDYFTLDFMNEPLVVARTESGDVSVLSNVCRHRGMPVMAGRGNTTKLRCPYHAWSYNLDGTLRSAPLVSKDKLNAKCNLPALNSRCWQGFIFVSLDSEANWPTDQLDPLETQITNYHMADMHYAAHFEEVWECNWKSLVENFMDGYHLSVVHPQTLHPLTPTILCRKLEGTDAYTAYSAPYSNTAPHREHCHPDLSETERRQSQLFCVYPTLVASVSADTLAYLSVHPVGIDRVFVKWGISVYEPDLPEDQLIQRVEKWKAINAEDHEVLKRLRAGQNSAFFDCGPLAREDYEGTLRDFHSFLRQQFTPPATEVL